MSLLVSACATDTADEKADEFPTLNSVPASPDKTAIDEDAGEIEEGLRADRKNARYTDEILRADTSVQAPLPVLSTVVTEVVEEEVTVTEATTVVTETVTAVTETVEAVEPPAAVVTETATVVTETVEPAEPKAVPSSAEEKVAETKAGMPAEPETVPASVATTVVSSKGVEKTFEQKLAASAATAKVLPADVSFNKSATPEAAPATTTATASGGAKEGGRVIRNYAASDGVKPVETVFFQQGSHRVNVDDKKKLLRIVRAQKQTGGKFKVVGHASSRTRNLPLDEHMIVNLIISQQRAAAVAEVLIELGVSGDDLLVESVSDSAPLSAEAMPGAESRNRRAEIFLLN